MIVTTRAASLSEPCRDIKNIKINMLQSIIYCKIFKGIYNLLSSI